MKSITIAGRRNDRLRILEVIGNSSIGGMENYIKNFITHLPPQQFSVTCICPYESRFTDDLRQLGVEDVFVTPIEDDPAWRSIQLTAEVARLHKIDVLHAHMPKAHVLAGLAGCLVHKPVIATIHGMNVTSHELGITKAVSSHLITNCQEAYTQALAMGVPSDRVAIVRNGVDTKNFTPANTGDTLRRAINVSKDTPLIGFVGRLEYEKGPDVFLRVAQYVHRLRPDVHFVVVGEGNMLDELKNMSASLQLGEQVHFVGWFTNTADIYPALDLLVYTSRSDGTSLVMLEAMACGVPAVGLAVGGVREIIENECTGLIVGAGDWEGLGIRILKLLQQPERLKEMGKAARARVEQHFDVRMNTSRAVERIRSITAQSVPQLSTTLIDREIDEKTYNVSEG